MIKSKEVDLVLGVMVPFIVALIILHNLWLPLGYFFYRDITPFIVPTIYQPINLAFFAWDNGPNPPNTTIVNWLPMSLISTLFNSPWVFNYYSIFVAFLPGPVMYFSAKSIIGKFDSKASINGIRMLSFTASLIYLLAYTNQGMLGEPGISSAISYSLIPAYISLFISSMENKSYLKYMLLLGVLTSFGDANPIWLISAVIPMFIYFLTRFSREFKLNLNYLRRGALSFIIILLSNSYVLIPNIIGFISNSGGIYSEYSAGTFHGLQITPLLIHSISHVNLFESIIISHGYEIIFNSIPADWTVFTFIIPVFAIVEVFIKRDRFNLFLVITLLIGIFLDKGANPPFGILYYYIVKYSPPGLVGLTFDVFPFAILSVISYSFLIGRLILHVMEGTFFDYILKIRKRSSIFNSAKIFYFIKNKRKIVAYLLVVIVSASLFSGTLSDARYVDRYFSKQNVPSSYLNLENEIGSKNGTIEPFKAMWVPTAWSTPPFIGNGVVNWTSPSNVSEGPGFPSQFLNLPTAPPIILKYLPFTNEIGRLLSIMQVKYIILHADTPYNISDIEYELSVQKDLKLIYNNWPILVFENLENVSLVRETATTYILGQEISPLISLGMNPGNNSWILENNLSNIEKLNAIQKGNFIYENTAPDSTMGNKYHSTSWIGNVSSFYSNVMNNNKYNAWIDLKHQDSGLPTSNFLKVYSSAFAENGHELKISIAFNYSELNSSQLNSGYNVSHIRFGIYLQNNTTSYAATLLPSNTTYITSKTGTFNVDYFQTSLTVTPIKVAYWFYSSGYRPISGPFLLGSYQRNVSIAKVTINGFPFVNNTKGLYIYNSVSQINVFSPISDVYNISFYFKGNLTISFNSKVYHLDENTFATESITNLSLSTGKYNLTLKSSGPSYILFAGVISSHLAGAKSVAISYQRSLPTSVSYTITGSYYSEVGIPYSSGWQVSHGQIVPAFNGMAIGVFSVNHNINLEYSLQKWVFASDVFFLIFLTIMIYLIRGQKKKEGHYIG